jgi:hypothetical protein
MNDLPAEEYLLFYSKPIFNHVKLDKIMKGRLNLIYTSSLTFGQVTLCPTRIILSSSFASGSVRRRNQSYPSIRSFYSQALLIAHTQSRVLGHILGSANEAIVPRKQRGQLT